MTVSTPRRLSSRQTSNPSLPGSMTSSNISSNRDRDARSLAQEKINSRVLSAIYHRRGDAKGKAVPAGGATIQVDRHGRALVDVRAQVRPELEKKIKALGGIIVSTSGTYDSIVGWMPLLTLERLAADKTVRAIEPARPGRAIEPAQ